MAEGIGALFGAILLTILFYIGISVMDKKLSLQIGKRNGYINTVSVWITGIFSFILWYILCRKGQIYENSFLLLLTFLLMLGMSVINVTDIENHMIPNLMLKIMLLGFTGLTGVYIILKPEYGVAFLFSSLAGGIIGGLIFFLCYLLSHKQLGAGDVKLVFVMGLYLTGQRIMGALFYGVVLCCLYSIIMLCGGKLGLKDGVPLAPFLYAGTWIALLIWQKL